MTQLLTQRDILRLDELIDSLDGGEFIAIVKDEKPFKVNVSLLLSAAINPTEDFIPLRQNGVFVDSSLQENETEIVSGKTIQVPGSTINIGANLKISDSGEIPQFINQAYDENYGALFAPYTTAGSEAPYYLRLDPEVAGTPQPIDSDEFNGDTLEWNAGQAVAVMATPIFGALVTSSTLRGGSQDSKFRITIRRGGFTGPIIWQSHNDVELANGGGFEVPAGQDVEIRPADPFIARISEGFTYNIYEAAPDSTISLKGFQNGGDFVPYFLSTIQFAYRENVGYIDDSGTGTTTTWSSQQIEDYIDGITQEAEDHVVFTRRGNIPANWTTIGNFVVPDDKEPDEFIGSFEKTTGLSRTVNFRLIDADTSDIYFDGNTTTTDTGLIVVPCSVNTAFPASGVVNVQAQVDRNGFGFGLQQSGAQMLLKDR